MGDEYEYVAVALPIAGFSKNYDRQLTEAINAVATHGWRLKSVMDAPKPPVAVFERPKQ